MKSISLLLIVLSATVQLTAAQPNQQVIDYIDQYKSIAVAEMAEFKIPASITLAQGILESGAGQSELAKESNNHFGIKCHDDWKGDKVYYDDDAKGECFRKYSSVEDSYYDHSDFLAHNQRYAFLFELDPDDYKGWAKGLKQAGYATNPKYADLLIGMIEEYELYKLDKMSLADVKHDKKPKHNEITPDEEKKDDHKSKDKKDDETSAWRGYAPNVYFFNRIPTIEVKSGDTPESIAKQHQTRPERLYKYNDLKPGQKLQPGSKFYLQPKRKKGETKYHTVAEGETMWSISQNEGVRLDKLYQYNLLNEGDEPAAGEQINLRKKRNEPPKLVYADIQEKWNTGKFLEESEKAKTPDAEKTSPVVKEPEQTIEIDQEEIIPEEKEEKIEFEGESPKEIKTDSSLLYKPDEKVPDSQPSGVTQPVYHIVEAKETLYGLSKKFGVTVDQLKQWNSLPDNTIGVGQKLIVGYQ